jgi:RecB family exonuclease
VNPYDDQMLSESASSQDLLFSAVRRRSLPKKYVFLEERWRDLQHAQKVLRARRSKAINGPYEGFIPSVIPFINQRYSPSVTWSASRLESYSNCPHQFFVNNALELEARVLPKLGLDSTQLGTMLHKILELTYKNSADMTDLQSNLASLQESSQKQFSAVPKSLAYRPSALWEVEKVQFLEKLKNTICELAKDANWVPFAFEKKFGLEGEPPLEILTGDEKIVIRGLIDRVDKNSSGQLRVLDYKTGGSHLGSGDLKDGYRLQLPIYAMAARDALHLGTPVDGIYWKILAAEPGSLKLASFNTNGLVGIDAAIQVVCEHLLRIISGIRAAEFPPQPPKGGCPSYCPAVQWCWRYEPGW